MLPLEHSAILLTCIKRLLENQFLVFLRVALLYIMRFANLIACPYFVTFAFFIKFKIDLNPESLKLKEIHYSFVSWKPINWFIVKKCRS